MTPDEQNDAGRIARLRSQVVDGVTPLPFVCYGCDRSRYDFGQLIADALPVCRQCWRRFMSRLLKRIREMD